jgi:N-glycosylase/DNA lyase
MEIEISDFSLDRTLNAGQTFAWKKESGWWKSFINHPLKVRQKEEKKLEFFGSSTEEVRKLLGLNDDLNSIKAELDKDDFLDKAIEYSDGIRVVQDGLWPATLGFILSIQSNIPLILRRISSLSAVYGQESNFDGEEMRGFPDYRIMFQNGLEKLKEFKLGFRTKFVFSAAEYFYNHELSEALDLGDLKMHLLNIKGVGEKVLDCVLLYGLHDLSAFPMDVWMMRVLSKHYSNLIEKAKSYKAKRRIMVDYFGRYAGYAQLYMYNYSRLNKIK